MPTEKRRKPGPRSNPNLPARARQNISMSAELHRDIRRLAFAVGVSGNAWCVTALQDAVCRGGKR
jgi:predicted HicB family RNase H-like nuclease